MPRPPSTRALDVWMNGEHVGCWILQRGEQLFEYAEAWLESPRRRPLSLSMPLRPSGEPYRTAVVQPYFENLLPDSDEIRRRMQARFGTASTDAFDLLAEAGRDCVGAVQLLPPGAPPPDVRAIRGHRADARKIAGILASLRSPAMGARDEDDFRISLAGAQEKIAFLRHDGRWMIPQGTTPTTHIFKLPIRTADPGAPDLSASVENEWLCAAILQAFGIPCATCRIEQFEDQRVLVVERFDRAPASDGSWIVRLAQEDFCQATHRPPGLKYESQGGPGILEIMELLHGSGRALQDRSDFFRTQLLYWLLCAIDGHAKNFSIFLQAEGRFVLTPRYDVLSAYPALGKKRGQLAPQKVKMAMAVEGKNRHYRWSEIRLEHWLETGRRCGLPRAGAALIEEMVERAPSALEAAESQIPGGFPDAVAAPILHGLKTKLSELKAALTRR